MVRALTFALALLVVTGCYPRPAAHSPSGIIFTSVAPESDDDEVTTLTASTAYAYAPAPKKSPPFDARAAREVLVRSDPSACGVSGEGHAKVTFLPEGRVLRVVVDYPPDIPPPVEACVREAYASVRSRRHAHTYSLECFRAARAGADLGLRCQLAGSLW